MKLTYVDPPEGGERRPLMFKDIAQTFRIFNATLRYLEQVGKLPQRPARGIYTKEYLLALAEWHKKRRGRLPRAASRLINSAEEVE